MRDRRKARRDLYRAEVGGKRSTNESWMICSLVMEALLREKRIYSSVESCFGSAPLYRLDAPEIIRSSPCVQEWDGTPRPFSREIAPKNAAIYDAPNLRTLEIFFFAGDDMPATMRSVQVRRRGDSMADMEYLPDQA